VQKKFVLCKPTVRSLHW